MLVAQVPLQDLQPNDVSDRRTEHTLAHSVHWVVLVGVAPAAVVYDPRACVRFNALAQCNTFVADIIDRHLTALCRRPEHRPMRHCQLTHQPQPSPQHSAANVRRLAVALHRPLNLERIGIRDGCVQRPICRLCERAKLHIPTDGSCATDVKRATGLDITAGIGNKLRDATCVDEEEAPRSAQPAANVHALRNARRAAKQHAPAVVIVAAHCHVATCAVASCCELARCQADPSKKQGANSQVDAHRFPSPARRTAAARSALPETGQWE